MNRLRAPLENYLSDEVSEASLHRVWQGVRKRRLRRARQRLPRLAWVGVAAALLVLCLSWVNLAGKPGPLAIEQGGSPGSLGGARPERVVLSDGSAIELAGQSSLEVLSNDGESFVTVLRRGRGTFDVKPGGSRRWRIEAGPVQVEVVGTRFTVERSEDEVFVHVERGAVLVRGNAVPDRVQRLTAGAGLVVRQEQRARSPARGASDSRHSTSAPERDRDAREPQRAQEPQHPGAPRANAALEMQPSSSAAQASAPPGAVAAATGTEPSRPSSAPTTPPPPPPTGPAGSGETPVGSGDTSTKVRLAETGPRLGAEADDITRLLRRADQQRLAGDTTAAIATLRTLLKRNAHDPRRPLAAFTLAKLLIDRNQLLEGEAALRTCLSMQPQGSLAENAWARLVEVQLRSGQPNAARQSAHEYARRYPNGQRLKDLGQLLEDL